MQAIKSKVTKDIEIVKSKIMKGWINGEEVLEAQSPNGRIVIVFKEIGVMDVYIEIFSIKEIQEYFGIDGSKILEKMEEAGFGLTFRSMVQGFIKFN